MITQGRDVFTLDPLFCQLLNNKENCLPWEVSLGAKIFVFLVTTYLSKLIAVRWKMDETTNVNSVHCMKLQPSSPK